jgi:hypothetical protein
MTLPGCGRLDGNQTGIMPAAVWSINPTHGRREGRGGPTYRERGLGNSAAGVAVLIGRPAFRATRDFKNPSGQLSGRRWRKARAQGFHEGGTFRLADRADRPIDLIGLMY